MLKAKGEDEPVVIEDGKVGLNSRAYYQARLILQGFSRTG